MQKLSLCGTWRMVGGDFDVTGRIPGSLYSFLLDAGMMDDLADRGYTYNSMAETQSQSVTDLDNLRQQVAGVSSDEELSNMIRFQHAYNASSRYITTVAEMIEHIINTLGV